MCPGLGSSNSSTSPSALPENPGVATPTAALRVNGDGGGLRDLDRRASSWRKGMGENKGIVGVACAVEPMETIALPFESRSFSDKVGNASVVDVTRRDFSTARRYFPTVL